MAPIKNKTGGPLASINNILTTTGVSTRSRNGANNLKTTLKQAVKAVGKRKAGSPLRDAAAKRAAFGDITNAIVNGNDKDKITLVAKKVTITAKTLPAVKVVRKKSQENKAPAATRAQNNKRNLKSNRVDVEMNQKVWPIVDISAMQTRIDEEKFLNGDSKKNEKSNRMSIVTDFRVCDEFSEESLYISAAEDISNVSKQTNSAKAEKESSLTRGINLLAITEHVTTSVPDDVADFDKENWNDIFQVSHYAMDIFNYLKSRENHFEIQDYLPRQKNLTTWMRALLVDWMVEVQESFELNHETLYLAVKLVDLYLCKELTKKDDLQLLGAASLFIAAKFDERIPPLVSDIIYICDGAYTIRQVLSMEISVLKTIGYDIGIPLSYRFLRRYARCARVTMPTLTLARFVLELCLMEYALISLSDSKMAAAALYLAIKMKNLGSWTSTHVYYTGYKLEEILPVAQYQNLCLHKKPKEALSTVRNKYSHRIFFEVAKVPLIGNDKLT